MLHEVSSFCRAFKGYRVHCRDTQMFPVVPRHTLASNIKDPFRMERHKRLLWALKRLFLLSFMFFETPCMKRKLTRTILYMSKRVPSSYRIHYIRIVMENVKHHFLSMVSFSMVKMQNSILT